VKRGTPEHPKTYTLAAILGVERWGAVGILESLWHFAQKYAPKGDVGRHADDAIARGIGWQGNPATLVSALAQAGWVDRCPCHRVRIHDWPRHADQQTERSIKGQYLHCYQLDVELLVDAKQKLAAVAVPSLAEAMPKPEPAAPARRDDSAPEKAWTAEAIDDHRELRGEPTAGKLVKALKPLIDRYGWAIVRPVWRSWLSSEEGRFGPHNFAANFLALLKPPSKAAVSRPSVGAVALAEAAKFLGATGDRKG